MRLLIAILALGLVGCASGNNQPEPDTQDQQLETLRRVNERYAADIANLQAEVARKDATLSMRDDEVDKLEARIAQLQQERAALAAKIEALEDRKTGEGAGGKGVTPAVAGDAPTGIDEGGKYHLRVITLPGTEGGRDWGEKVQTFLQEKGLEAVVLRQPASTSGTSFWVIDVGHIESHASELAKTLQAYVQDLSYEGRREFKDAYYVSY